MKLCIFVFQFWAIFIKCTSFEKDAVRLGLDATDVIHKFVEKYDDFELATTAQGIRPLIYYLVWAVFHTFGILNKLITCSSCNKF